MSEQRPEGENPALVAALLEAVDAQLRDGDPPETRQTLDRLTAEGHSEAYAKRLIALVLLVEGRDVLESQRPFDRQRFVAALDRLPQLSM